MEKLSRHSSRLRRGVALIGLALAGWLAAPAMPAQSAPNTSFGISIRMLNPPNPITDLVASPVGSNDGDVQLVWTAPRNLNGSPIQSYTVRFATYPAASVGVAESWWNALSASQRTVAPAHAPGVTEFTTVTGLTVGTTFYFGIKSIDADSQLSPIDARTGTGQQAQSMPLSLSGPPGTPTGFSGVAVSTYSVLWSWDATATATFYTLNVFPSGAQVLQTSLTSATEAGLTANVAVSRTIKAGNFAGMSNPTLVKTVYTHAAIPSTPTLSGVDAGEVEFTWAAGGNPGGTQYRIERSLDGLNFLPAGTTGVTSYTDSAVTVGTTYYYRVSGVNGDGVISTPSGVLSAVPTQTDFLAPQEPLGLKGTIGSNRQTFTLTWGAVVRNADLTPTTDVVGYHVYRRSLLSGTPVRITTNPVAIPAFADVINGALYYYTLRAIDSAGNESVDSLIADTSPDANVIFLGADGQSAAYMPQEVAGLLSGGFNKYGVGLTIDLVEDPVPANTPVVRSVRLRLLRGDTREQITDVAFKLPDASIAIGYAIANGQIVPGAPLASAAAPINGVTPADLSLFWNNGATFVNVGGTNDPVTNTIRLKTSFLGQYQLRISAAATSVALDKSSVYPRLITPNGDGLNDRVYFIIQNPNNAAVRGEILDKDGRLIRTLLDPSLTPGIGTTMTWDGRDNDGNVVPGGAYIYRIEGEGNTFTGTVGVAR